MLSLTWHLLSLIIILVLGCLSTAAQPQTRIICHFPTDAGQRVVLRHNWYSYWHHLLLLHRADQFPGTPPTSSSACRKFWYLGQGGRGIIRPTPPSSKRKRWRQSPAPQAIKLPPGQLHRPFQSSVWSDRAVTWTHNRRLGLVLVECDVGHMDCVGCGLWLVVGVGVGYEWYSHRLQ